MESEGLNPTHKKLYLGATLLWERRVTQIYNSPSQRELWPAWIAEQISIEAFSILRNDTITEGDALLLYSIAWVESEFADRLKIATIITTLFSMTREDDKVYEIELNRKWRDIEHDYIMSREPVSFTTLSELYGVNTALISAHSVDNDWVERRKEYWDTDERWSL